MKNNLPTASVTKRRNTLNTLFYSMALAVALSLAACDSTKEVMEDDAAVEVSENTVTNPDTTKNTK